jgi:hypothetical protein
MKTKISLSLLLITAVLVLAVGAVNAQPTGYASISWWSVDGGGGSDSAGHYVLNSAIGQTDAGLFSGGNYILMGGYLSGSGSTPTVFMPLTQR